MKRKPGVWRPGIRTAPRFPKQAVQEAQEVVGDCSRAADPRPGAERDQGTPVLSLPGRVCPRSPRSPNQAGPSQHRAATRAVPPRPPRGASRPLRKARDRSAGRTDEPQLARSPPTWRELGPGSAGRSTAPGSRSRLAERSSALRRDQRRRDPPATPRPAPPSSQLCGASGPGGDVARGARREARGARARRGRAAGARGPWSARSLGGGRKERAPSAASASYFLSGFLLEEEKHLFPASFVFLSAWRLDAGAYF